MGAIMFLFVQVSQSQGRHIMALLVYDFTNEECMLKWCDDCLSTANLRKHTSGSLLEANDTDDDICYSQ